VKDGTHALAKSSLTCLAASTLAGELRSGTSCDKRLMTEISYKGVRLFVSVAISEHSDTPHYLRQSPPNAQATIFPQHLHIRKYLPLVRARHIRRETVSFGVRWQVDHTSSNVPESKCKQYRPQRLIISSKHGTSVSLGSVAIV
jgi:hypothetical protein